MSRIKNINLRNIIDAAVWAGLFGFGLTVLAAFGTEGFSIYTADWIEIGKFALNSAITGFIMSLGKNFFTDENRMLFGKIKI